jgi:L-ascorbate metabolism protein UlaG (beta-lactamase superfamily)
VTASSGVSTPAAKRPPGRSALATERLTWLGHATVLLEVGGARLLTDPVLRDRVGHLRRRTTPPAPDTFDAIDAVLISHIHLDHLDLPSLRRLGRETPVVVPRGAGALLRRHGFRRTVELEVGGRIDVRGVEVAAVPALHDGRRLPWGPVAEAIGFVVGGDRPVYFAGDTALHDGMHALAGTLDVALLPVWGWGPTLGDGHMDPLAAAQATALLRPRAVVPIHWGTLFPAGLARVRGAALVEPPRLFARYAGELAPGVGVRILTPGGSLELDA